MLRRSRAINPEPSIGCPQVHQVPPHSTGKASNAGMRTIAQAFARQPLVLEDCRTGPAQGPPYSPAPSHQPHRLHTAPSSPPAAPESPNEGPKGRTRSSSFPAPNPQLSQESQLSRKGKRRRRKSPLCFSDPHTRFKTCPGSLFVPSCALGLRTAAKEGERQGAWRHSRSGWQGFPQAQEPSAEG